MARTRYKIYNNDQPHFLTMTIVEWIPLFMDKEIVSIILNSLKYIQQERGVTLYAYVVMENHLHMVASGISLNKTIKEFKSFTARCIITLVPKLRLGTKRISSAYFTNPLLLFTRSQFPFSQTPSGKPFSTREYQ